MLSLPQPTPQLFQFHHKVCLGQHWGYSSRARQHGCRPAFSTIGSGPVGQLFPEGPPVRVTSEGRGMRPTPKQSCGQILAPPLAGCVSLGELLNRTPQGAQIPLRTGVEVLKAKHRARTWCSVGPG